MKKTMKLAGIMLAIVMVVSMMSVMALADNPTYTITVNIPSGTDNAGGSTHESYSAWKVLTIDSSVPKADATPTQLEKATYIADANWLPFFTSGYGKDYFDVSTDGQNYITLKDSVTPADVMPAIAKEAVAYAIAKPITADATQSVAADATSVALNVSGPGWYAVNSSVGTICMLTNNDPTDTINDKNLVPTVEKEVTSITGSDDTSTVSVGDTVNYTATITAEPGAENYIFHDTMDEGLTFDATSVKIGGAAIADVTGTALVNPGSDGDTFEITFTKAYLDAITAETSIVITYSAVVNDAAIDDTGAISNTAKLTYGNNSKVETTPATADVYTYGFEIIKTDENNKVISGATFELYDAATGGNKILLALDTNGSYRPATAAEIAAATGGYVSPLVPATTAKFDGFGNGTYYLQEVDNPKGYNKLATRTPVTINGKDIFLSKTFAVGDEYTPYAAAVPAEEKAEVPGDGGIQIINKQGSVLPETGGAGTTVIYMLGTVMVLGAAVLFVSKKRMGAAE